MSIRRRFLVCISRSTLWIFFFLVSHQQFSYANELFKYGTPFIKHFTKKDYKAGNKNWSITQDSNGFIYVGNSNGLLQYDGIRWKRYNLPSATIVRSVFADGDRIYTGSLGEFGYWEQDEKFDLSYISLIDLIEDDLGDEEIWWIVKLKDNIIFQSFSNAFIYDGTSIIKVISDSGVLFPPFYVNDHLYVQLLDSGLVEVRDKISIFLPGSELLINKKIKMMVPSPDGSGVLIGTENHGFFIALDGRISKWNNPSDEIFQRNQINRGLMVSPSFYAVGTILGGVYLMDMDGNIVSHIDKNNGLNNNTVLSLMLDKSKNLWVGMDNGLDLIKINSPLYYNAESIGDIGSVYTSAIHRGYMYLGTNSGIYYVEIDRDAGIVDNKLSLVPGSQGQIWSLKVIDNVLFCGHNSATYIIEKDELIELSNIAGGYDMVQYPYNSDYIIQGAYSGLFVYKLIEGKWSFSHGISGFTKLSKTIEFEREDVLWVSHPYRGLYRLELNEDLTEVIEQRSFSEDKKTYINKLDNKLVFSSDTGFIYYDEIENSFSGLNEVNGSLEDFSSNAHIIHAYKDKYWIFKDGDCAIAFMDEKQTSRFDKTLLSDLSGYLISGHEDIYVIDTTFTQVYMDNGFGIFDNNWRGDLSSPSILLREINFITPFGEKYIGIRAANNIPFKYNSLRLKLSFPEFARELDLVYKLEGYNSRWTSSNFQEEINFQNLPYGSYTFRAMSENGSPYDELTFNFTINPPWYQSSTAKGLYILLSILSLLAAIYLNKRKIRQIHEKHEFERKRMLEKEAAENEKKLIEIRNENLRNEIKLRNSRLAKSTFSLIHKNNTLISVKEELTKIKDELGVRFPTKHFNRIVRNIDKDLTSENDWKMFEQSFSEVHEHFLLKLKEEFTDLTPADIQLCAYLKMNLSSKEIASLLNISLRGVEVRRYRVRKKLHLEHDTNLVEFIMGY